MKEEVIIYNNARTNQQKEITFRRWLLDYFPNSQFREETYYLPNNLVSKTLAPIEIAKRIQKNSELSLQKKANCIRELIQLPKEVKVITSIRQITVDFTIISESKTQHIEFHESQHFTLNVPRASNLYSLDDEVIKVPRYLQRLLRDIWRLKYIPNYQIVWHDWFETNKNVDIFKSNLNEFALPNKFKISDLA
ncbi:hypothetical protein [Gelidibacter japonicus]|uniref:hypothetical protein n=1 Tax=Gelidibacter japonicus TaxID=1962232 RepID=UPI003A904E3A